MANRSVTERRWFPTGQPQTLQIAVLLLYWNAFLSLLLGLFAGGVARIGLLLVIAEFAGAYGVANEKKWGYGLALVAAILPFLLLIFAHGYLGGGILTLVFQIALVALLLHPQSRAYYKIWFR
jgi:hypothetical protein